MSFMKDSLLWWSVSHKWDGLKMSPLEAYIVKTASEILQGGDEDPSMKHWDVELESKICSSCKNGVICVHLIL